MSGKKISYATILAAKSGEAEAMTAILRHHMPYIVRFSKRSFYDDYGNHYETVNEDVRQHIVSKLMEGIIRSFDPSWLPPGETLEE